MSVSTTGTPATATAINPAFPAPAQTTPVQFTFQTAAGAQITLSGATVTITGATKIVLNDGTQGVARLGDSVTVSGTDSAGDTFTATGTITSASHTVLSG